MELSDKVKHQLAQMKSELSDKPFKVMVRLLDNNSTQKKEFVTYLECLQYVQEIDPRKVNSAKIISPDNQVNWIDVDELQLWRTHNEHYRIEVRYLNHDQGEWKAYPHLIKGFDNAMAYQPGDFFEQLRIRRMYDNKIVHQESSRVYKLIYADGSYDFCTNCSYRMAESIGMARCKRNGTDYNKLVITEAERKSKSNHNQ